MGNGKARALVDVCNRCIALTCLACPDKPELPANEVPTEHEKNRRVQIDTDDKWFNNPQFRIKVNEETKVYVCLTQRDQRLSGTTEYIPVDFMVINNKDKRIRVWEKPLETDVINQASLHLKKIKAREITQIVTLKRYPGKSFGYYIIVPNVTEKRTDKSIPFWLRLFSSAPVFARHSYSILID
jgi:hypothetical protein